MLVKRVVGVGGDVIDMILSQALCTGTVKRWKNPMCWGPTTLSYDIQFPITVPQGQCVFLLGDNRNGSGTAVPARLAALTSGPFGQVLAADAT